MVMVLVSLDPKPGHKQDVPAPLTPPVEPQLFLTWTMVHQTLGFAVDCPSFFGEAAVIAYIWEKPPDDSLPCITRHVMGFSSLRSRPPSSSAPCIARLNWKIDDAVIFSKQRTLDERIDRICLIVLKRVRAQPSYPRVQTRIFAVLVIRCSNDIRRKP